MEGECRKVEDARGPTTVTRWRITATTRNKTERTVKVRNTTNERKKDYTVIRNEIAYTEEKCIRTRSKGGMARQRVGIKI